jgi:hypothetical protein
MFGASEASSVESRFADGGAAGRSFKLIAAIAAAVVILALGGYLAFSMFGGAKTGVLAINSNPPGAPVSVDGTDSGKTPVKLTLPAGPHSLAVGVGADAQQLTVDVVAGEEASRTVELQKAVATGDLQVASEPAGAAVSVDGIPRGNAPTTVNGLAVGAHTVLVTGEGGRTASQQVEVVAGTPASVTLTVPGPSAPPTGVVRVNSPIELQISENGRALGASRSGAISLTAGRHTLTLANEELGFTVTQVVDVTPGGTSRLEPALPNGRASFNADPWAEVWIGGQRLGETPLGNVSLPIGTHQVSFRHPQFGERQLTITVTVSGMARLTADLRK